MVIMVKLLPSGEDNANHGLQLNFRRDRIQGERTSHLISDTPI